MSEPSSFSKDDAQERADQIAAFRAEVARLQQEGASPFTDAQLTAVSRHHDALLGRLAGEFDIDRTVAERRMSAGMRVASAFGAFTLTAAVVSFVYQVWGTVPLIGQIGLLTVGPLAATTAMIIAGRIERTRYVAAVMALVACGAFVLQTVLLADIFNLPGSPHAVLLWALFAIAIAWPWRFALPFGLGTLGLAVYAGALSLWLAGIMWVDFMERPEPVMLAAAVLLPVSTRLPRELITAGRAMLLLVVLAPLLLLSLSGGMSLLPWKESSIELAYQLVAGAAAITVVGAGVRFSLDDGILIGSLFGGVFLLTRFVDWWWDWMPRYVFFLILAGVALLWIWALRVLRRAAAARTVS